MGSKTIHTCDHCGKEFASRHDMVIAHAGSLPLASTVTLTGYQGGSPARPQTVVSISLPLGEFCNSACWRAKAAPALKGYFREYTPEERGTS
jgi:hypothetical protein